MDRSKWEYKKLGEVATFERGLTYSKNDESDSSTKGVLRSNNIDLDSHQLVFDEIKYLNESFEIPKSKKLVKDSIFICMSNGSKAHLGKVAYVDKDYDYAFGGFMGMIRPHNIYPKYLFYYFLSKEYRDGLEQIGKGANINNLRFAQLANFIIPDPSKDDQQRIVAELDCLNEMIALKREQLKEFDKLAQSIFYDMFGDPVNNEKGWARKKLEELYKVTSSKRILQSEWQDKGVPFYKVADIVKLIEGDDVVPNTFIMESTYNELKGQNVVPLTNDVLITSRGTLGLCYIVSEKDRFYFQDGMITWLSQKSNSILPVYLKSVFETDSFLYSLLHNANMSTVAYLSIGQLSKVEVPLPPLALQQEFAEKIQAIEAQKELVKKSIAETQQLLDSRMDYYFN